LAATLDLGMRVDRAARIGKNTDGPPYQKLREQLIPGAENRFLRTPQRPIQEHLTTAVKAEERRLRILKPFSLDLEWRNEDRSSVRPYDTRFFFQMPPSSFQL